MSIRFKQILFKAKCAGLRLAWVGGFLSSIFSIAHAQVQLGADMASLNSVAGNLGSHIVSISGDGATSVSFNGDYQVIIQKWDGNAWNQKGSVINLDPLGYHYEPIVQFNHDGSRVAIGLPHGPNNTFMQGYVRVYEWSGGDWAQMGTTLYPAAGYYGENAFVRCMRLSSDGQVLAISDPYPEGGNSPESVIYFYSFSGTDWVEFSRIRYPNSDDYFGKEIDLSNDGKRCAVSAPWYNAIANTREGRVFVYEYNGIIWQQLGNPIEGMFLGPEEGEDVAISGDGNTIVTDSRIRYFQQDPLTGGYADEGAVRVFEFNGNNWVQKGGNLKERTLGHFRWGEIKTVDLNRNGTRLLVGSNLIGYGYDRNNERQFNKAIDYFIWQGNQWANTGFVGFDPDDTQEIGVQVGLNDSGDTLVTQKAYFSSRNNLIGYQNQVYRWCFTQNETTDTTACDSVTLPDGTTYYDSQNGAFYTEIINNCLVQFTVDITILKSTTGTDVIESCSPITWIDGNTYNSSNNTAQHLLVNAVGCDSLVTLDFTLQTDTVDDVHVECADFTWIDGITYTSSNNTAIHTLSNIHGCDSVVHLDLTLTKLAGTDVVSACDSYTWIDGVTYNQSTQTEYWAVSPEGCDSLVSLELTILNSSTGIDEVVACDSYTWIDGNTYNASTNAPTHTLVNAIGCDSVVTLDLTIHNSSTSTDLVVACDAYTWIDGITYTSSNTTASFLLQDQNGCDSTVFLDLTIANNTGTDVVSACDSYTWIDGLTYVSSNNSATHTLTNTAGCDSVVSLDLTILSSSSSTDVQMACGSYTWQDGVTYTASNNSATHTLINEQGCDSVITLNLTILEEYQIVDVQEACNSYTWIDGNTYNTSNNTASITYNSTDGCDSTITLDLTLYFDEQYTHQVFACDSYTWIDGVTYTASNSTATHLLQTIHGCDSLVSLDLTMGYSTTGTDVIVACDSHTWIDGITYTTSNNTATHTLVNTQGCDSTVSLDLTINYSTSSTDVQWACDSYTWMDGKTYFSRNNTATHVIPNSVGCDSVITLDLTIMNNTGVDEQLACESFTWIDGNTYTQSNNTATHTLINQWGCDSVVTLDLTIGNNAATDVVFGCDSYTWIDGIQYITDNNTAQFTLTNSLGCDSVVTLDLTMGYSNTGVDPILACDSYTWIDGITYTASNNTATHTLTNASGCDSVVTLDLEVRYSSSSTDSYSTCAPFVWMNGQTYNANNYTAQHIIPNSQGCDSVITLDLTILNSSSVDEIFSCDAYTWVDGNTYSSSNNTATYTFTNQFGCDSVVTLDLTILSNSGTDVITACGYYTWIDGNTYFSSNNTATQVLTNSAGCDSTVTLDLTILPTSQSTDVQSACDSYTWIDGNTYTVSNNTATHVLTNTYGCDSVITLDLTIWFAPNGTDVITACDSYIWQDGNTYTASNNTATHTLTTPQGCDSIVHLDLTILESSQATDVVTACESYTWIDGTTYTTSNNTATHVIPNSAGCDSVISLDLTILSPSLGLDVVTACNSYTWIDGITYTNSTDSAQHVLVNSVGCDSVVTLDLTLHQDTQSQFSASACESYVWNLNGVTYTNSGVYSETISSSSGCDSTVTLDLNIYRDSYQLEVAQVCNAFFWDYTQTTYTQSGTYFWNGNTTMGCDSTVELQLTVIPNDTIPESVQVCESYVWPISGNLYTQSGTYTYAVPNAQGCFDVHELDLTIWPLYSDTAKKASCVSFYWPETDSVYSTSTVDEVAFFSQNGCDSILVLDLVIFEESEITIDVVACDSLYWEAESRWLNTSGVYTEYTSTQWGCDSTVHLNLNIQNSSAHVVDTLHCAESYFWEAAGTYLGESGQYQTTLSSIYGCDSVETLNLMVNPIGEVTFTIDGSFITVQADMVERIQWTFCTPDGQCSDYAKGDFQIEALHNGSYFITLGYGPCETAVEIPYNAYDCRSPFFIPNSFSPNGDEVNDVFEAVNNGCPVDQFHIQIFNRWGHLIFESNNPAFQWDGRVNGKLVPAGMYVYQLDFEAEGYLSEPGREVGKIEVL